MSHNKNDGCGRNWIWVAAPPFQSTFQPEIHAVLSLIDYKRINEDLLARGRGHNRKSKPQEKALQLTAQTKSTLCSACFVYQGNLPGSSSLHSLRVKSRFFYALLGSNFQFSFTASKSIFFYPGGDETGNPKQPALRAFPFLSHRKSRKSGKEDSSVTQKTTQVLSLELNYTKFEFAFTASLRTWYCSVFPTELFSLYAL